MADNMIAKEDMDAVIAIANKYNMSLYEFSKKIVTQEKSSKDKNIFTVRVTEREKNYMLEHLKDVGVTTVNAYCNTILKAFINRFASNDYEEFLNELDIFKLFETSSAEKKTERIRIRYADPLIYDEIKVLCEKVGCQEGTLIRYIVTRFDSLLGE